MDKFARVGVCALALGLVAGCHTATRTINEPRVDFDLPSGGNRGYLVGTPPPERLDRNATREMVETEFEIPATGKATGTPPSEAESSEASSTSEETGYTAPEETAEVATSFDSYVVEKGDTLWSIAAKPEIYGDATKWRRIFNANKALLKSPDRIKAGMKLQIPRGGETKKSKETEEPKEKARYSK